MAQFYTRNRKYTENSFDSSQMFMGESKMLEVQGGTYLNVLDMFRKVFKHINYNDLFA